MNIALPLPFSTMIGVLKVDKRKDTLALSSTGEDDPGIYLAIGSLLFKLPLSENFIIEEARTGELTAVHKMKMCGIPFLRIDYTIRAKEVNTRLI